MNERHHILLPCKMRMISEVAYMGILCCCARSSYSLFIVHDIRNRSLSDSSPMGPKVEGFFFNSMYRTLLKMDLASRVNRTNSDRKRKFLKLSCCSNVVECTVTRFLVVSCIKIKLSNLKSLFLY